MNFNSFILFLPCLFSFCLCEITEGKKSKLLSDFINYYNFRPNVDHKASDGFLQSISEIDDTTYQIEVSFIAKRDDVSKILKCSAGVQDLDDRGIAIVNNVIDCEELEQQAAREADASLEAVEDQAERRPVLLETEEQIDSGITSGEQFITIPRSQPNAPCVGCVSHVNRQAQGVQDLAHLGVRHLDVHDPSVKHSLDSVIDVERQVQVVDGVKYILTLSINFNNCSGIINDFCTSTKTCRISILTKPWKTLLSGAKYRAITSNNCTEEWKFGDNNEALPEPTDKSNHSKKEERTSPATDNINIERHVDVQSIPNKEKTEQILLYDHVPVSSSWKSDTLWASIKETSKDHVIKTEPNQRTRLNSLPETQFTKPKIFSPDKKKAIDEMLDFLNVSGYKPQVQSQAEDSVKRSKRSYDYDLQVLALTQDYRDLKKSIENAKYVYEMAQAMVNYLNAMDIEVKNRAVKNVIKAEEEEDNDKHFVYIQAQIVIPCDTPNCEPKETQTKICNGVLDNTNKKRPQVLYTFCYTDSKEMEVLNQFKEVESDDPVLLRLSKEALKKIEFDSTEQHAMKIKKIASANTRLASGRLTKISMIVDYINCNKSVPLVLRKKCSSLDYLGSRICEVLVHERQWLKEKTITYTCTERPMDQIITKDKQHKNLTTDDPKIAEILQDALQYLEIQSSKKNKQKIIKVSNISTQIVAGFLIKIEFVVGYTNCTDTDMKSQPSKCELLRKERLRRCKAQVWDRSWIIDGRQMEVLCDEDSKVREIFPKTRGKRDVAFGDIEYQDTDDHIYKSLSERSEKKQMQDTSEHRFKRQLVGGEVEQNPKEPVYVQLAQESLQKYMIDSGIQRPHSVNRIDRVTTQVASGSMTRINFVAAPNNNSGGNLLECFSKIWEQSWLNKKEIDVACVPANNRIQRRLYGGEEEQNPNEPVYMQLAQECLQKYIIDNGIQQPHSVVRIDRVTTQVVSGSLTRINFVAARNNNSGGNLLECFSKIWEQSWLNKKEIDVSCVPLNHRLERPVAGGEVEQNPNEPVYVQLAQESLKKYKIDNGIQQPHSVVRIDTVTTQVVSGYKTRINFIAAPNTNSDGHVLECFSKIWEQTWLNKKEIDVSCVPVNHRFKRQVAGGEVEQNPNEPVYVQLAQESLKRYTIDNGIQEPHSVVRIDRVTTQVVSGSLTRINFVAARNNNSGGNLLECFSKIWEQSWLNKKEIDVSCVPVNHRLERQVAGGEVEQNPNEPVYVQLAQESLQKYTIDNGIQEPHSVVRIDRVTTQVVSGSMTRINFVVARNNHSGGNLLECFSKIWEQSWLNKKEIDVSCVPVNHRFKRQLVGGLVEQNPNEPVYMQLAQESLKKYTIDNGIQEPHSVVRIDRVTTQVVSGSMSRINFVAAPNTNSDGHVLECFSKIWEQSWLNKKEIDVSCVSVNHRFKRQLVGGLVEQNPNEPVYMQLAQESLQKYTIDNGIQEPHSVVRIDRVTTQVVSGSLTRINFVAARNNNSGGNLLECFSKIWEQSWLNKKEIDVSCVPVNHRLERQVAGGEVEQNPNEPVYVQLAQESLQKYTIDNGIQEPHSVVRIDRVTTQVVSGSMTRINFVVARNNHSGGNLLECFSKIWEQSWLNKKEIDVSCVPVNHRFKRQLVGGLVEQNPNEPVYMQLAQESLKKYTIDNGIQEPHSVVRIDRVTTQVVSGSMTRINFVAAPNTNSDGHVLECFSKIWEQSWLNKKEIDVSCVSVNHRFKRQLVGGLVEQNPNEPVYMQLAQESLQKYTIDNGIQEPHSVVRIDRVTTQVVSGSLTRINFVAARNNNSGGNLLECFSKIWEQSWLNKKEIDVSCVPVNHRFKRQLVGGLVEQNPNEPVYMQLAQESLKKYTIDNGIQEPHSVVRIDRVTTQVVSGSMTRINFVAAPNTNSDGHVLECFSKIWEQSWLNKKEIDVSCVSVNHRFKRQLVGGLVEQNPNEPVYMQLAQESLQKYTIDNGIQEPHSVVRIDRVTTQVVSGSLTRINFVAARNNNSGGNLLECFSKIWEQSWLNKKEIDVSCVPVNHRLERQVAGGEVEQNPNEPVYVQLAQESLQKYTIDNGIQESHSVVRIDRVTTQVVSGSMTRINFVVARNNHSGGNLLECFSKIWEQSWLNKKEIDVSCVPVNHRFKRQLVGGLVEQNPNEPVYMQLAQESLQKYTIDNGIQEPHSVVRIDRVTTQVVSGFMTRINFVAAPNTNSDGHVLECFSKIWEQSWLNKKEIDVSCVPVNHRFKRQLVGGLVEQNPNEPVYVQLAQESLKKYTIDNGIQEPHSVVRIDQVTTQVVSGSLTRISFVAARNNNSGGNLLQCFSKIWEQSWLNKTEIDVSCFPVNHRLERQVAGGEVEQNPNEPVYVQLAQESLKKYTIDNGIQEPHSVVRIDRVTTQVVSGSMTRINFVAARNNNSGGNLLECFSKIWEQSWLNKKEIDVSCVSVNHRFKRQLVGGSVEQNPNEPVYMQLAQESLQKYTIDNGIQEPHSVVRIDRVTTQVVSGSMTRINFVVARNNHSGGNLLECFSKIWEQSWLNKKEIDVSCVPVNHRFKRQLVGGLVEQNPNEPVYVQLAQESLKKYTIDNGIQEPHSVVRIDRVTTQVVSGFMTRISFVAAPNTNSDGHVLECFSKIWEQSWLNKKEINVSCIPANNRIQRRLFGGEEGQNPNEPIYVQLAQESLQKYIIDNGIQQPHSVVRIDQVTTQVVSGSLTRISFVAARNNNSGGNLLQCFSKIWEQSWLNKTEIDVSCFPVNHRLERQVAGGEVEQNPNEPVYVQLAQESLKKYTIDNGIQEPHSVVRIDRVTTQVVSGSMTRINFLAARNNNSGGNLLECFSKIWEQSWLNKKEIDVSCVSVNHRFKRQLVGGSVEQNPNEPVYMQLAQESLQKYTIDNGIQEPHSVVRIDRVTTQVVSGFMTRINFVAAPNTNSDGHVLECFSKIWEQSWLNKKEINVSCIPANNRIERRLFGGEEEQNPNEPIYVQLAQESLQKYIIDNGIQEPHSVVRIDRVTTQVVSGSMTRINFVVARNNHSGGNLLECFSKIWEQSWLNKKEIDVSCVPVNHRFKRQLVGGLVEQNPNEPVYVQLAQESLKKYTIDNGIQEPHSVVRIDRVTTQVVSGFMTRINFVAAPNTNSDGHVLECFSKIWEQSWLNKKEINVSCIPANNRIQRRLFGGEEGQNPNEPIYVQLAQESLQKYIIDNGIQQPHSVVRIDQVTTQVVSGSLTRISFVAARNNNSGGNLLQCFSKIWEQSWLNKTEIDVSCFPVNHRLERQVAGGEVEQNPNEPVYVQLAQESLKKYTIDNGIQEPHSVVRIDRVTTQVVSGSMTRINFVAARNNHSNGNLLECFSKIWEQSWLNKTEIDVSCFPVNHRLERQVAGGEVEQNPNEPVYVQLAQESLKKYTIDNGIQEPHSVVRIDRVTTQVVSGSTTRINFVAARNNNSGGNLLQCFSKIWEQSWLNKKEINVSCIPANNRIQRRLFGGEERQNPNEPIYVQLAQESLQKYIIDNGIQQPHSVVRIDRVTTQVVSGSLTRINFVAAPNTNSDGHVLECFSKIWEQSWLNKKEINVSCITANNRIQRRLFGGEEEQNPNEPIYVQLAQESLQKYIIDNGIQQPHSVVRIDRVTTQVVSGSTTRINFVAARNNNSGGNLLQCFSKIWEQSWLNKKEINVSCIPANNRIQRRLFGGEERQNPNEPIYVQLAQESLQKYIIDNGIQQPHSVVRIDRVTTQVVSGSLTRINFVAAPNTNSDGHVLECFSKIWEQSWLNKKEINVSCITANNRIQRRLFGGEEEQNPNEPIYVQLAQESLQKYIIDNGIQQPHSVVRIDQVTTQVVSGSLTRINFVAARNNNSGGNLLQCFSKIWEQSWLNKTEIDVSCFPVNHRLERQVAGGEVEQNPNEPVYVQLARESLKKYTIDNGIQEPHSVVRIDRVTTQVVSGSLTRINFVAARNNNSGGNLLECFSKIWEQSWLNKKEIDVSCVPVNHRLERQVAGGEVEQNPNEPVYVQLAQESLKKYKIDNGIQQPHSVVRIDTVTTQVVSGSMTRINFVAAPNTNSYGHVLECFSKIWEQSWLNKKEIDVSCVPVNHRFKRHLVGGLVERNPNKPVYMQLAQESLQKYLIDNGIQQPHSVVRIDRVTTQVVSGSLTRINFVAARNNNSGGNLLECFSKIWEQSWLNKKEIDVSCVPVNHRLERPVAGGEVEQNPNEPVYVQLAQESLKKYTIDNGIQEPHSVVRIDRVTTQVVSGSLTRINFVAARKNNSGGNLLECFSKIWEQSWLNKTEIDVSCFPVNRRLERQVAGGEVEQNPNEPVYVQLAQESLKKYTIDNGIQEPHSVVRIDRVTTQVVSGSLTRINFVAARNNNSGGNLLECFSKIWEQSWLNKKEINVSCIPANNRIQRRLFGGEEGQNPNEPIYVQLAQESLQKYIIDNGIQQPHSVVRIDQVTTQVVSGSLTRINFVAARNNNSGGNLLQCFSKIWEQSWLNKTEIDVSCFPVNHRLERQVAGGEVEQNPNEPVYVQLAQESLKKYTIDNGIQEPHSVVRIDRVTTQVVSGSMTRINFVAARNNHSGGNLLECFSKIWEQSWLNKTEIDVSCFPVNHRLERQVAGGEVEQNPNEPVYVQLAQESLKKYTIDNGIQEPHSVVRIDRVTTQVVSGSTTRINFVAARNNNSGGNLLKCFSKIWEQSWLNKKEINVSCIPANNRIQRLFGGEEGQNPNEPIYVQLAQESLQKYIIDNGIQQPHSVVRIDRVTTQVVSGSLTRINFVAAPNTNSDGHVLECFSKIWEQSWLNKKEINVSCITANNRIQRRLFGGEEEQNPNEPIYVQLAQESLQKYIIDNGIQQPHSVVRIDQVTTQVVSGSLTRINFVAARNNNSGGNLLQCFSKIWEQSWLNKTEIDVSCFPVNHRLERQVAGGEVEQNPNEPVYVQLAQESLKKYTIDNGIQEPHSVVRIDRVTTQVVSGSLTRINFVAARNNNSGGNLLECFSKIWEQSWLNKKEIDVSCVPVNHRLERQVAGGEVEQNPNEPVYVQLAQESLNKYKIDNGIQQPHSVVRIDTVTTQVVSGSMTRINFVAAPNTNSYGQVLECFSKIWEQSWLNKKEIDVSCVPVNHRFKRHLVGGLVERNPNKPVYMQLAQESLQKYIIDNGIQQPHSVVRIDRVTTQVVSGSLTRINFEAARNINAGGNLLECFSKIWEQSWLNKKEIDVSCVPVNHRLERPVAGGEVEQNPNEPVYVQLAQESLKKYTIDNGIQQPHSVVRIDRVTTQVVSGSLTRINFVAARNNNSGGNLLECFSKIWEQSWLNKKEIDVSCVPVNHRLERPVAGGEVEQNPNEPVYVQLAQESLKKYTIDNGIQEPHSVVRIDRVTTQVVSGSLTRINFVAARSNNPGGNLLQCFSKIWEQSWLNKTEIDVSCFPVNHRLERQVAGGEVEQNPNGPVYVQLAQESLKKYTIDKGIQEPHSVVRIDRVTTQVVSGSMTRINFVAAPNTNSDGHVLECFSKIWEQSWLNKKEINVSCIPANNRIQRRLFGGEEEQNPNEPIYVQLAQESLQKYIIDNGIQQPHSVVRIDQVTTQVVSGSLTRINFVAARNNNSGGNLLKCFSKIWEQSWLNKKEIDVSCFPVNHRLERQVAGGEVEQNPNEPVYVQLAQESLKKYTIDNGIQEPHSVVRIDRVTTQVVSGSITRINFVAAPNTNSDGHVLDCFSKIWEQSWLNIKEINVSCIPANNRIQRRLFGGEEGQNPNEPIYVQLAQESLQKYIIDSGIQQPHSVVRIDQVTTQVVSGSMTRINFVAARNNNSGGNLLHCFSKIWEQSWLNKTEIDVSCFPVNHRLERQVAGGEVEQNPNVPVYVQLAQESLKKYTIDNGIQEPHSVVRIDRVTTQVVSGSMTRINFVAARNNNSGGNLLECFSKIWEQSWLNKKEIDVSCVSVNHRFKRQLVGGLVEQNPNEPVYIQLAQESLQKYTIDNGIQEPHSVVRIDRVTTQVVSGSMTRINFVAAPNTNSGGNLLECFSKIWEQSWLNKKEIDVSCVPVNHRFKRQLVGGLVDQNPNEPVYVPLAQESLKKYTIDNGIQEPHSVVRIDRVTTQVVSGSLTRIYFVAAPNTNSDGHVLECFSKIWEQSWLNKKEIDVSCVPVNHRFKRQLVGGLVEQNPNEPIYVQLAQETLQKYIIDNGIQQPHSVVRIDQVTTQIVSGSLTRINFVAARNNNPGGNLLECFSKIWEQSWLNKKEIDVSCFPVSHRLERQDAGGEVEQNPNELVYVQLAQESLKKYTIDNGIQEPHSVVRIDRVTTQVVSGSLTRINFVAAPNTNSDGHVLKCFSKIWKQFWLNKKEIDVSCVPVNHRFKRQLPGGEEERYPNKPVYMQLAQESLQKYIIDNGIQQPHSVVRIDRVTTQIVAGSLTRINFLAARNNSSGGNLLECFSKIWEQSWLNKKEIDVSCVPVIHRFKRQIAGGEVEQNPNEPVYVQLAQESLKKYTIDNGIQEPHSVFRIDKVTTQVVSGSMTRINFVAAPNTNSGGNLLECFSKVWEQSWLNKKEIDVSCVPVNHRFKRQLVGGLVEQNPNKPVYMQLAQESLQKYIMDNGIQQPHSVVRIDRVTTQIVSGSLTRINFVAARNNNSGGNLIECLSNIWEQSWLNKKEIYITCVTAKHRFKRQLVGGEEEKNPNEPVYVQLAQESLRKYIIDSGIQQSLSVVRIDKVTTQVVSGSMTRINFVAAPTNNPDGKIYKCFAKIWEQPLLNKKEINVFCEIDNRKFNRDINGSGLIEQDPCDPKYFQLAEKSLQKYLNETYNKEPHKVVNVQKVTTQIVSGILTRLNFIVISINVSNSDVIKCYSEVWDQSLTENENIEVSCQLLYKNAEDPKNATYLRWAKESLQKYLSDTHNNHTYKVVQIEEASWQGFGANIIFIANSTEKHEGSLNCVSVILNMAEISEKKINVICEPVDSELKKKWNRMEDPKYDKYTKYQYTKHNNIQEELAVTKPEFQLLASQSLRQYSKKVGILHKLFAVKMVTKSVMSDVVYKIYFTAFPTDCFSNVSNMRALTCNVITNSTVNCRTKFFGEPSLQTRNIQAECVMPEDYLDLLDSTEENANEWPSKLEIPRKTQDSKAHNFAEEALQEYLSFTDTKYVYRITGIYSFYEHLADEKIEFSISPTTCLTLKFTGTGSTDNCPFKQPRLIYYCNAKRNSHVDRKKDIKVTCKRIHTIANRSKRQINTELIDDTENEVDEDTMYYYAKAAVSKINEKPQNNNMFKLVTIHAVKSSVQMKAVVVKMYLEVAETYCVRFQSGVTIENCEEMEGLNHKLCLARIFPAPGDDLVVRHVNVVCDDDEVAFNALTGIHVFELLRLSLQELERKPEFHFKLVHQGEPQLIPTLEAKKPLKLNFIIATTNCSKNVDLDKNPYQCYIDTTIPSRSCSSFIWLETATRIIKYINVDCNSEMPRQKRSSLNATSLTDSAEIKDLVSAALEKLEMASLHRYKQRVLHINSYSSKITTGKVTTIDFDVAYTSCLKYEWVQNITSCDIIDHLPRRHCVAQIWERLWIRNGRHINVTCEDDETPLEAHIEFESAEMAMQLAQEALKHIEAKYPHPQKQKIVRIFSLEKQIVAGIHYKMKVEVGFTHCLALSSQANCTLNNDGHMNRFCRVNVWVRPWTDHPPNFRVSCDFQESATSDLYHGVQAEYLFSNFVATYNPSYSDDHVEFERRFDIFRANIKKIHELNVHEKGTATYGLTRFADLTYKEFKARYMGLNTSLRNNSQVSMKEADIPNVNLPANFDWREFDSVTEVKDQGSCGSGWAFSVIGNIEGQWRMQSGELVQLSEQQLLDCDNKDNGCGGGLPEHAYRAIEEMGGLETETNYPYEAEASQCLFNRTMAKVKIQGAVNITSNETAMAQWLVQNGPISIGINAMAMQFYLGGISHPWTSYCNASNLDHAALIVGFGVKEYPAFHKKIPYWIVKNSWGKSWGEEGYYRVYRGDGTCGIDRMATSAFIPSM